MIADHPTASLGNPQGILIWVGAWVLWSTRCDSLFRGKHVTQNDYLAKFYAALAPYTARGSQYSIPPGLAERTREAVKGYLSGGQLPLRQPCPKLELHRAGTGGSDRKNEWIKGHLEMYMQALNTAVGPLVEEGYIVLWTDAAKEVRFGIHVAGAGVFYGQGNSRNLSEPLPYGEQTNNRAELWAFIQSLRRTPLQEKLLIISDSSYVVKGIALWSAAWREKGWRSKGKLIPNADLWSLAVSLVQARPFLGVMHVFSHVGVPGSEGADTLASASLDQHPLLARKPAQPAQSITPTLPTYHMPHMVQMNFIAPVPQLEVAHQSRTQTLQPPVPAAPAIAQPRRLSAQALVDLQHELLRPRPEPQAPPPQPDTPQP